MLLTGVRSMTLATVNAAGIPAARIILLKGYDEQGFTFFTSTKAIRDGDAVAYLNLVFFLEELER